MYALPSPKSASHLWSAARQAFKQLRLGFAGNAAIAHLGGAEGKRLRAWLCALEAFVRRIALLDALALPALPLPRTSPAIARRPLASGPRRPGFRLWPRAELHPVRISALGPATSMREILRERRRRALVCRLQQARLAGRMSPEDRIARRLEALERVLDKPSSAVRRLARKLRAQPRLRFKLATAPMPRSHDVEAVAQNEAARLAFSAANRPDSS